MVQVVVQFFFLILVLALLWNFLFFLGYNNYIKTILKTFFIYIFLENLTYLSTGFGSFERLFDESLRSERAELKPLELEVLLVLLITKKYKIYNILGLLLKILYKYMYNMYYLLITLFVGFFLLI